MAMQQQREYELVLLGATGYTGKLTAEHIAAHTPTDLKWAIAGRNRSKLEGVFAELSKRFPDRIQPGILTAEHNEDGLGKLAQKAKLLISTVGPYSLYGTPVVDACVRNKTHYIDCTGEGPWLRQIVEKYHDLAEKNETIVIPQCGIDSVPADLLTWMLAKYIRQTFSSPTLEVINSLYSIKGKPSGGTMSTALTILDVYSLKEMAAAYRPFALSPIKPSPVRRPAGPGILSKILGYRNVPEIGNLTISPQAPMDMTVIHRSWGLLHQNQSTSYGPNFHFHGYLSMENPVKAMIWHYAYLLGNFLFFLSPVRWLVRKFVFQPGEGLSEDLRKKASIEYRALGVADDAQGSKALATLKSKSDGYYFTGICMIAAALALLRENDTEAHKRKGGVLTPALLGDHLVERLREADVTLEVRSV